MCGFQPHKPKQRVKLLRLCVYAWQKIKNKVNVWSMLTDLLSCYVFIEEEQHVILAWS